MVIKFIRFFALLLSIIINCIATTIPLTIIMGIVIFISRFFSETVHNFLVQFEYNEILLMSVGIYLGVLIIAAFTPLSAKIIDKNSKMRKPSSREIDCIEIVVDGLRNAYQSKFKRKLGKLIIRVDLGNDYYSAVYGSNRIVLSKGLIDYAMENGQEGKKILQGFMACDLGKIYNGEALFVKISSFINWPLDYSSRIFNIIPLMAFDDRFESKKKVTRVYYGADSDAVAAHQMGEAVSGYLSIVLILFGLIFLIPVFIIRAINYILNFFLYFGKNTRIYQSDKLAYKMIGGPLMMQFLEFIQRIERDDNQLIIAYTDKKPPTELRREKIEHYMKEVVK